MKLFRPNFRAILTRRFVRQTKGNLSVVLSLSIIPLVLAAGLAIDYSRAVSARVSLQQLSDAAALSAAAAHSLSADKRTAIARDYIAHNKRLLSGIEIQSVTVAIASMAVDVRLTASVPGTLIRVMNLGGSGSAENGGTSNASDKVDVAVHSKASLTQDMYVCLLALNPSAAQAIKFYGTAVLNSIGCGMQTNSSHAQALVTQGTALATAPGFCSVGNWSGEGFTPDPQAGCAEKPDPYANLALPTVGSCDYTNKKVKNGTAALTPGVYCGGLSLQTDGVATLAPGTYIIKDGAFSMSSGSSISGTGVTIYLVGKSYIDIGSQASISLKAPTTGPLASMVIIQDKSSNPGVTNTISSGGNLDITGAIYMPSQTLKVWGNGDINTNSPYFPIIADKFEMSGNGTLTVKLDWKAAGFPEPTNLLKYKLFLSE